MKKKELIRQCKRFKKCWRETHERYWELVEQRNKLGKDVEDLLAKIGELEALLESEEKFARNLAAIALERREKLALSGKVIKVLDGSYCSVVGENARLKKRLDRYGIGY